MVVFVDLESDDDDTSLLTRYAQRRSQLTTAVVSGVVDVRDGNEQDAREAGFAAVLTCYPYANTEKLVARPQVANHPI